MGRSPQHPPSPLTAETIWHKHREFISGWLRSRGVRVQDLEDVTSEVFIAIIRSLHTYDPDKGELRGWLFRIVERQAQRYREQQCAGAAIATTEPSTAQANPEDSTVSRLLVERLLQEIKPEKRRLVFMAYALHDMTIEEICDAFSIPENTARTWIRRSYEDFEKAYKRHQAELSRIGAAPLAFSAFVLLDLARREGGSVPGDVRAERLGEPIHDGEPTAAGRSPRDGFDLPRSALPDLASHVGSFIAGAAAMFALLRLVPSRPWEPIEPDRSPVVVDSSVTVTDPIPAISPTLAETPRAAPADSARPASVPNAPLVAPVRMSRAGAPAEEHGDEGLIRGAEAACARGDSDRAQFLVDHHAEEFPNSRFASERERIRGRLPCMAPLQAR
jgi:RNA polymerase sigma-70 factor (ECF subfamily)